MSSDKSIIAIDFGSTKVVSAYLGANGRANIITDAETNRMMLNCTAFTENQCLVGNGADYEAAVNAQNTIRGAGTC